MEYRYLLEEQANPNIDMLDLIDWNDNSPMCFLNILCYHIDSQHKYPFLQFIMEKIPDNNIVKEQFILPYLFLTDKKGDVKMNILDKVRNLLIVMGCDHTKVTDNMYKGILFGEKGEPSYAMVNISGIDIYGLNLKRNTSAWFILPSEIINTKKVCNIRIDSDITNIFTDIPQMSCLVNPKDDKSYILPDVVYTGGEMKRVEFNSVFGNRKSKVYKSCGEYYYFYRSFDEAVKEGGWKDNDSKDNDSKDNDKYIQGGINRYALFTQGKIYLESEKEFSLSDETIENLYPEPTLLICYIGEKNTCPNILVKDYDSFVSLSYHMLNKSTLKDDYSEMYKNEYMIV